MAAVHSFSTITLVSLFFRLLLLCLSLLQPTVHAAPTNYSSSFPPSLDYHTLVLHAPNPPSLPSNSNSTTSLQQQQLLPHQHQLAKREKYTLALDAQGNLQAISESTRRPIPQAPASDGAGAGFDAPAILWIGFSGVVGLPMMVAGLKLGRVASGIGFGCAATVLAWAAIINSMSETGLSDLTITLVSLGFFLGGALLGLLRLTSFVAPTLLALLSGLSLGIRLVLLRPGLLVNGEAGFPANWGIISIFPILSAGLVLWKRTAKMGVAAACAGVGTFFVGLAGDLVVSRQGGMSRGLRVLFDRNSNHIVDIVTRGYRPGVGTLVIIGVSLGLVPVCAYAQHRFFPGPFLPTTSASYTDPTMGRFVSETESIAGDPTDSSTALNRKSLAGQPSHLRPPNPNARLNLRNSVISWFRRENLPAPGRPGAAHVYQPRGQPWQGSSTTSAAARAPRLPGGGGGSRFSGFGFGPFGGGGSPSGSGGGAAGQGKARIQKVSPLAREMGAGNVEVLSDTNRGNGYGHVRGGSRVMNALEAIRMPRRGGPPR